MTGCEQLDRWLDEGRPAAEAAAMEAHAAACPRCGRALAADAGVEEALRAAPIARAPRGFAESVMAEVTGARGRGPAEVAARRRGGWRLLANPWVAAGAAIAVALAGSWRALSRVTSQAVEAIGWPSLPAVGARELAALERAAEAWARASVATPPWAMTGFALTFAAAATAGGWLLLRWTEAVVVRRAWR